MTKDQERLIRALRKAIGKLDTDLVEELTQTFIAACITGDSPVTTKATKGLMNDLRQKCFFGPVEQIASRALELADPHVQAEDAAVLRRELAQARIDSGDLGGAIGLLRQTARAFDAHTHEGREARGLQGRIAKQRYVNDPTIGPKMLAQAVEHYWSVYSIEELRNTTWWHGINVVACLARAERDGHLEAVNTTGIDWRSAAKDIYNRVKHYTSKDDDFTFAAATSMEACVALERGEDALEWCELYIDSTYADMFELGSTERQLREVWQLGEPDNPGSDALRLLQGALGRKGGSIEFSADPSTSESVSNLTMQAQLGNESAQSVQWIENLLGRCKSVIWIASKTDPSRSGTGFLVSRKRANLNGRGFPVPQDAGNVWLVTNCHVLNENGVPIQEGTPPAIRLVDCEMKLTMQEGQPSYDLGAMAENGKARIIHERKEEDFVLVALDLPELEEYGLPLSEHDTLRSSNSATEPRLYVIGHPNGGVMKVSLYDNDLVDIDPPKLTYRSPTEKGSSGSPVLSSDLLTVALHRGTLSGDANGGPEPANTGVLLDTIARQIFNEEGDFK